MPKNKRPPADGGIGVDFSFLTRRDRATTETASPSESLRRIMNDHVDAVLDDEGRENVKEVQFAMRGRCPTSRVVRNDGACVEIMLTPDSTFRLWDVTTRHLTAEEAVSKDSAVELLSKATQLRDAITPRKETPSLAESESPLLPGVRATHRQS